MSLDNKIRELCAIAADTKEPASLFRALQELKELIREHDLPREILPMIDEQPLAASGHSPMKRRSPRLQS
jgi:hypothetical protein